MSTRCFIETRKKNKIKALGRDVKAQFSIFPDPSLKKWSNKSQHKLRHPGDFLISTYGEPKRKISYIKTLTLLEMISHQQESQLFFFPVGGRVSRTVLTPSQTLHLFL